METFDALDGVLLVDKPAGPTSHDIVDAVRRHFGLHKVGHAGTLDPNATGLLILLLGRGTKLSDKLIADDKVYAGTAKFGESTDSYDADGKLTASLPVPPLTLAELNTEAEAFIGDLMQTLDQAFERISRLNRVQAVSSGINSIILRSRDRRQLLEEACRIAVERGDFGMAWVGMLDPKTLDIIPAACAGIEVGSLTATSPNSARADSPRGQGFMGRAIREKRALFTNDLAAEPGGGNFRRQEALRRGYRSMIAIPLMVEDRVVGVISLFAKEANFFDDEEVTLLTDLAGNVSFALEHIHKAEALADTERKLESILSTLQEVVWSMDPQSGRLLYVNAAVKQLTGRPAGDFVSHARLWRRLVHPDDRASVKRSVREAGNSADQLPVKSPLRPSSAARQVPFQPVRCICADQEPRSEVAPLVSRNVQKPRAAPPVELGSTV